MNIGEDNNDDDNNNNIINDEKNNYINKFLNNILPTDKVNYIYDNKIKGNSVLLDNPIGSKREKPDIGDAGLPKDRLNAKQRKYLMRSFTVPKNMAKYELFIPLNQLWNEYIIDCVGDNKYDMGNKLIKADLHGCIIKVIRSVNPTMIGHQGIIIKETQQTFRIVSKNNQFHTLLKKGSWFEFNILSYRITLFGSHFCYRPAERTVKKFKSHGSIKT